MITHNKADSTKARIERAALDLFVKKGVTETTVRDITRQVDITEGALYRHFSGKDELVWQLFEGHYVAFAARLEAAARSAHATRDKLAAMIHTFCDAHDEDPTLYRFLLFVQHGQLSKLDADTPTPVTVVHDVIAAGIASGELPQQEANLATALVFGIVLQPTTFAAYGRLAPTQASYCDRLVTAAWAALSAV